MVFRRGGVLELGFSHTLERLNETTFYEFSLISLECGSDLPGSKTVRRLTDDKSKIYVSRVDARQKTNSLLTIDVTTKTIT